MEAYSKISMNWAPKDESRLRAPLDSVLMDFWGFESELPMRCVFVYFFLLLLNALSRNNPKDYSAKPLKAKVEPNQTDPRKHLKGDFLFVCEKLLYANSPRDKPNNPMKRMLQKQELLNKLLDWGLEAARTDGGFLLRIIAFAMEFKPASVHLKQVINQCTADLQIAAAILELLDIPFPSFGMVVSYLNCIVYTARARLHVSVSFCDAMYC
jgi:hypothetical protein